MKALILGDGLLGTELHKQTKWDYWSRKKNGFDIKNIEQYDYDEYDTIINCIAHTDTYSNDKEKHWDVNCLYVYNLINLCNNRKKKLVHISTDYIYSGSVNNATEDDVPVHCNNWYGYTKLFGDGLMRLLAVDYLIIRCTHKPKPFPYDEAWINQVGNFDYVDTIANLIIKSIEQGLTGCYNVGTELKTMFDLSIKTRRTKPVFAKIHIPENTSMSINKFNKDINYE